MAIKLIRETEHLTCESHGVTFHYRRPTQGAIQFMREQSTKRGIFDDEKFGDLLIRHCVFNWEGQVYEDDDKTFVPFAPESLAALPLDVRVNLVTLIGSSVDGTHLKADPS